MSLSFDPAYLLALKPLQPVLSGRPVPKLHDISTRRSNLDTALGAAFARLPEQEHVVQQIVPFHAYEGAQIELLHSYVLSSRTSGPTAVVIHAHAGGMISGSPELFAKPIAQLIARSGVPFFSVAYRKAPEYPHPYPTEDVYAALLFVQENASRFNIDPARIALLGESAGGGIAAGVALMARDRKLSPPIAKQILIYPMLDDTNIVPDPTLTPFAFWSYESNLTGWTALLGAENVANLEQNVSPYAAPARCEDLRGLPRTYLDTGELDIFRDEAIAYIARLAKTGVSIECHVYPGVPHAFDWLAPDIEVSRNAIENRIRTIVIL